MSLDNSHINEDLLEIIEVYLTSNTGAKNIDKQKTRTLIQQLISSFMGIQPRSGPPQFKLQIEDLFTRVDSIERQLYIHNFSYASCVREKIESKACDKDGKGKDQDDKDKENEEDLEADNEEDLKDLNGVKIEQNCEDGDNGKDDDEHGDGDNEDTKLENGDDRDSFDKIIDQKSDDSSKDQHTRPMEYTPHTEDHPQKPRISDVIDVYPKHTSSNKLFYGGHQFYVCFRFYYTLFERLLKAAELAKDLPKNKITDQMTSEDREKLINERYESFKEILKMYLAESFEPAVYEDCLRCIYGRDAGFLFSLDKILANLTRSLPSDELSVFVIDHCKELFNSGEELTSVGENVKYAQISFKVR